MYYIEQLKAYYESEGFVGEVLEKAIEDDKQRVLENLKNVGEDISFVGVNDNLSLLFYWKNSAEGWQYWSDRARPV